MNFDFYHSKLRKQPFFAENFKIQRVQAPLPTPMSEAFELLVRFTRDFE